MGVGCLVWANIEDTRADGKYNGRIDLWFPIDYSYVCTSIICGKTSVCFSIKTH